MTPAPLNRVLIIGAGLAGPALAIALAKQSIRSTILERRPFMQDIGGVIMLAPNALRVLDRAVGVADEIRSKGYPFDAIHIYTKGNGATAKCNAVGGFRIEDQGTQGFTIARPVLHKILLDRCESMGEWIEVRYGAKLDTIEEGDEGVVAVLEDGERVTGDALIGADGIGSPARKHILGSDFVPAEYSGIVTIGCILPQSIAQIPSTMNLPAFIYTPSGTFLIFAMDPEANSIQWATSIVAAERDRKGDNSWEQYRLSGQAANETKTEYGDVQTEPIKSLIDHLSTENARIWAPYQVRDIPTWHSDRVCLVGDAAHAIPPSAGQGAAQAFEDIGYLSRLLGSEQAREKGYKALFSLFEEKRRQRVDLIKKMTKNAESGRGRSKNGWMWLVKSWSIWAAFSVVGFRTGGFIKGSGIVNYDVMEEDIEVGA